MAFLLSSVSFFYHHLSIVVINIFPWSFRLVLEKSIFRSAIESSILEILFKSIQSLLELFILGFVGSDSSLKGARLDRILIGFHQSFYPFQMLFVLTHSFLSSHSFNALKTVQLYFEVSDLFADVLDNLLVIGHFWTLR